MPKHPCEIFRIGFIDGEEFDPARTIGGAQSKWPRLTLRAPVVQRLLSPDPFGLAQARAEFAGAGLQPIDAPHVACQALLP